MESKPLRYVQILPMLLLTLASTQVEAVDYTHVQPLLQKHCVICHSGPAAARGLRLDSYAGIIKGSEKGAVVKSGDPANSELVKRLSGESLPRMPMTGPPWLNEQEMATIKQWIRGGLQAGQVEQPAPVSPVSKPPGTAGPPNYAQVAPIFATRCAKCHSQNGQMGAAPEGYILTSYAETMASDDRARIVPGNADASELVRKIRGQSHPRMPFDGPPWLSEAEIALIVKWINQGAADTSGKKAKIPAGAWVRLHGQWQGNDRLDGLKLETGSYTRWKKSPRRGDYVEVRGIVMQDGTIRAERIRRR